MCQALYIKYLITSSLQYSLQVDSFVFIFWEETEAQRDQVICHRSHLMRSLPGENYHPPHLPF